MQTVKNDNYDWMVLDAQGRFIGWLDHKGEPYFTAQAVYDGSGNLTGLKNQDGSTAALGGIGGMAGANNLSEVTSQATARTNLGLGNVNNTSDALKPVSDATLLALNAKVPTSRQVGGQNLNTDVPLKTVAGVNIVGTGDVAVAPLNAPADLGTGGSTLTASVNADRYNFWRGAADAVLATNTTGATRGMMITISHEGTGGVLTLGATAPAGYKSTLGIGEVGQIVYNGTAWQSAIPASGGTSTIAAESGSSAVGSTLTCTPAAGWTGTFQWRRAGADIGGATASTYVLVSADAGLAITCKFTPTFFTTNAITAVETVPGAPTAVSLGAATANTQVVNFGLPATGSPPTDYTVRYRTPTGSGSFSAFSDGTSTALSITVTGLAAATPYDYTVEATNGAGTGVPSGIVTGSTGSGGSLTSADITMPATVNLTTGGYIDYIKRRGGLSGEGIQKTGFPFIVFAEGTGGGDVGHTNSTSWTCTPAFPAVTTTDGIGMGSLSSQNVTGETAAEGLYNNGGTPFNTYTIPCGTTPRVVEIVWGSARNDGFSLPGTVGFTATLSDGSAAPITRTAVAPSVDLNANTYCTRLTFNAASAGQHLTISPSMAGFAICDYVALIS